VAGETGAWRILYEIHDDRLIVLVLDVRHRSTAYRK
jgi:mRNA-degrading endonuclease RelE of RelBE toxin-antitoxin system